MRFSAALLSGLLVASLPVTAEAGPRRSDQHDVRQGVRDGKVLSLDEIVRRVVPTMAGMQYLGPEYDAAAKVYRLKFIDKGRVVFVDVDARTGHILRQR